MVALALHGPTFSPRAHLVSVALQSPVGFGWINTEMGKLSGKTWEGQEVSREEGSTVSRRQLTTSLDQWLTSWRWRPLSSLERPLPVRPQPGLPRINYPKSFENLQDLVPTQNQVGGKCQRWGWWYFLSSPRTASSLTNPLADPVAPVCSLLFGSLSSFCSHDGPCFFFFYIRKFYRERNGGRESIWDLGASIRIWTLNTAV